MNAIPLINIAPPRNDNVNKISNKLNNIPVSQNISGAVGMFGNSGFNNETQLRQEVNTSLVALKREAFNLETLINQAAKTLTDVNNRIAALENVQGDYVKKTDVTDTIESGNMNPLTSNAVATSNAMPVNSVTSGNLHSVTSNAVADMFGTQYNDSAFVDITSQITVALGVTGVLAYRKNNIVVLKMEGTYSGVPTTTTQEFISNMPSKYCSSYILYCCGLAFKNEGSKVFPARLTVRPEGKIEMSETAFPNGAHIRICIMYLI